MRLFALMSVVSLVACSGTSTGSDGGSDGGSKKKIVEVTGNVRYDPAELAWRCLPADWTPTETCANGAAAQDGLTDGGVCPNVDGGIGYPPCLKGDTFKVEDAIKALANLAPLQTIPLTETGLFDVKNVDATNTTLALVGTVQDPSGKLVYSGYGIGRPPFKDNCDPATPVATGTCTSGKPIYVASAEFLHQLARAMHEDYDAILAQGVVIAHITADTEGRVGVSGAKIRHVYGAGTDMETTPELTDGVYYINADLTDSIHVTSADDDTAVTSASGLIVRLNAGNAQTYTAAVKANPALHFEQHLNGSRPGTAIEVFFPQCAVGNPKLQEGCPN